MKKKITPEIAAILKKRIPQETVGEKAFEGVVDDCWVERWALVKISD